MRVFFTTSVDTGGERKDIECTRDDDKEFTKAEAIILVERLTSNGKYNAPVFYDKNGQPVIFVNTAYVTSAWAVGEENE